MRVTRATKSTLPIRQPPPTTLRPRHKKRAYYPQVGRGTHLMMTNARQFVYQFDDQNEPEEIVIDMRGEQEIPSKGCIINSFGRRWKVIRTATKASSSDDAPIPVHFVALTPISGPLDHRAADLSQKPN